METNLYTTLGMVAQTGKQYLQEHGTRTGFIAILDYLKNQGQLSTSPSLFRHAAAFLSPDDFLSHAYSLPLNAGLILSHKPDTVNISVAGNKAYSSGSIRQIHAETPLSGSLSAGINENIFFLDKKDISTIVLVTSLTDQMHTHDYFEINYVYRGSYTQIFETEKRTFHKGHLVIIAPDSPHMVYIDDDNSIIVSTLIRKSTFEKMLWPLLETKDVLSSFFRYALYDNSIHNYLFLMIDRPDTYEHLLQHMLDESNSLDVYANTMTISYTNLFFGTLLREFGHNIHPYISEQSMALNADFPLMIHYLEYNYATVSLSVLSELFHYREEHISKMFKKYLNRNFSSILQDIRLKHAKDLLDNTDYTIEKIAELVGYDSSDYLTRIFKKKYGTTPSSYRKQRMSGFASHPYVKQRTARFASCPYVKSKTPLQATEYQTCRTAEQRNI